jgi:hypothetical protein
MRRRLPPTIRAALAVPVLALLVGAASACGSAQAGDGVATAGGAAAAPQASAEAASDTDRMREFAQCMRDNGVPEFPDPDPDGGGMLRGVLADGDIDRDKLREAMQACRSLLPNGGQRRELDPEEQEKLREWAQCMRDNGVDVPDPDPNGGGLALGGNGGNGGGAGQRRLDPDDPAFRKAMEACQDKFVFRGRGGGR